MAPSRIPRRMSSRRISLVVTAATLAVVGATIAPTSAGAAETVKCGDLSTEIQQLVRPSSGANLLTKWDDEAALAERNYGFKDDLGTLADVAPRDGAGLNAIWRLYKSGDFIWAADGSDADKVVAQGYQRQFVDFFAAAEDTQCLAPVYRLARGPIHRMANSADAATLARDGWTKEGVAFYAVTEGPTEPTPPTDPEPTEEPEPPVDPAPPTNPNPPTGDTKFSIAVLPDTQNESNSANDPRFKNRATWLAQNKSALDLRFAMQIGDLVNWGQVAPAQFANISAAVKPLEAAVPWSGAIGNHDTGAVCPGGSACPGGNAHEGLRVTTEYNKAFPVSRFPNVRGTYEPGKIDNAYQTFSAGKADWLVLNLELWPRTAVVNWAKKVVADHPDHNVIVVTHHYLEGDGSIGGNSGGYGDNSPRYVYDNLIKAYPNIKLVLSGHVGNSAIRTDTGVNGNKVVSMLQSYHSTTNPVRLIEIDTAAGTMTSKVYAPLTQSSYPGDSSATNGLDYVG